MKDGEEKSEAETDIRERLFSLADADYRDFQRRLIPNVAPESVIGVRVPALRALAKQLYGTEAAARFLGELPHAYYDENNLHGLLLERVKDYGELVAALDEFLPFVDNWATCDIISPKAFGRNIPALYRQSELWLGSAHVYAVRFGLEQLMTYFLDESFTTDVLELAASVVSEEYYIRMIQAWLFATALAKQYPAAVVYIEKCRLDAWTHNKAIQKAVESRRVSEERKAYLKTLKI